MVKKNKGVVDVKSERCWKERRDVTDREREREKGERGVVVIERVKRKE